MTPLPTLPLSALRVFHIGGYWRGLNDMVRQMMLGLHSAGVTVREYSTDEHPEALDTEGRPYDRGTTGPVWLRWDVVGGEIEAFAPHLVVCNAGGLGFRPPDARRLRERACLLGIALSDPDVFEPATRHIAPHFDIFLTTAGELVPVYAEMGVRSGLVPLGTHEEIFYPVPSRPEHACDVLVVGRAHPDRVEPVRALNEHFDLHLYGEAWGLHGLESRGLIFGEDLLCALGAAGVTVVFFRMASGYALIKVGLFDFLAAGALVATDYFDQTARYLRYGEEIVGFSSTPELIRQVRHYLDHPDEARAIREAGRAKVLEAYTWRQVWPDFLRQFEAAA